MKTNFEVLSTLAAIVLAIFCAIGVIVTNGAGNGATLGLLVFGGYASYQMMKW